MIDNHEGTQNSNVREDGFQSLSRMPSFKEFRERIESEGSDNESIESLEEEKDNIERLMIWREAMTDLYACLSNVQPGDDPRRWQREFFEKYDIAVVPKAEGEEYEERFDDYVHEAREKAGEEAWAGDWKPEMLLMDRDEKRFSLKKKVAHEDDFTIWRYAKKTIEGDFPHALTEGDGDDVGIPDDTDFVSHPETAEMLNTVLADLFGNNIHDYSEITKNDEIGYYLHEKDAYDRERSDTMPGRETCLKAMSEIEQILSNIEDKDELEARLAKIDEKIKAFYDRRASIRSRVELEEKRAGATKAFLMNFDKRLQFDEEEFEEELPYLVEALPRMREEFSDEGLKRIGIIEESIEDYDDDNVRLGAFSDTVMKIYREYFSGPELDDRKREVLRIAKDRANLLDLEEDELKVIFGEESRHDKLANSIIRSIGVEPDVMRKLLGVS